MRPRLTLRGERTTPDGTQDVIEPRRGALCCSAIGMAAAKRLPTSTKDAPVIPDLQAQPRGVEDGESGVHATRTLSNSTFMRDVFSVSISVA
jgi:hypothetical protein